MSNLNSTSNPPNPDDDVVPVPGTTTIRTSDGAEFTTNATFPDVAYSVASEREALVCDVLKRNHYTRGNYYIESGFNLPVYHACSGYLQEVHVTIDAKRVSRKMRVELARALYPFPVVLHTRHEEFNLPIVPPVGSTIKDKEYWEMAKEKGVYSGEVGPDGKPLGAPPIEYWEEDEVNALEVRGGLLGWLWTWC
ncbi:hypothetical protein Hypma_008196 [Hypsizygus marmoreus]|uniref:Uncharacterized protein n=1 Tax=Hypsizygus marmoreus TaxID=39966 RepID=A0A369JQL6_HYPMA|nr:hypothetical protein Hypma_008196 [Hypsizygus marmoreus]